MRSKIYLIIFTLCIALFNHSAIARMYQWVDPQTGATQLSGKPPSWYRGSQEGPRIIVFEKGKVIDDTAIKLVDDERLRLRNDAFSLATQSSKTNEQSSFTIEQ